MVGHAGGEGRGGTPSACTALTAFIRLQHEATVSGGRAGADRPQVGAHGASTRPRAAYEHCAQGMLVVSQ